MTDVRRWLLAAGAGYAAYKVAQRLREERLQGQVVLITGGSRGLGFLLAREFAREGCRVAICARNPEELRTALHELERNGADVHGAECDVADRAQVDRLVAGVTARFGRIDILVNNAGIMKVAPVEMFTAEDFHETMDVMFWGVLHTTLAVLPQMRVRRSGRIVNIASIGGLVSVPHLLPYNCAKFAAVGLSQGLRAELARDGIRVTTIAPGIMRIGSHLNVQFAGQPEKEFAWFSVGESLPPFSVSAERAVRQIVRATKRGEALRIIGVSANILGRLHGLFPGTTANVLGLVNRFLPAPPGAGPREEGLGPEMRGHEIEAQLRSRVLQTLTRPGRWAAERTRQFSGAPGGL